MDSNGGKRTTYSYDGLGQLVRENNPYTNKSYVYAYDKGGNITSVTTYAYTTGALGTATSTVTYTYGDTAWKDKLTSYNGTNITYDSIGNPLSYRNGTLAWAGRQLKSHTSTSGTTTLYTYNSDGVRIGKKSVYQGNTSETSYVVSGTQILSETKGSSTNYYIYDEKGLPIGIVYNGTTYTYRKNLQGDIIAILDSTGAEVVTYTYNAWGVATVGGSLASTLGAKNPFRYRGYYYDSETGYYYLNSRYYDPVTGRFLNADGFVSTGQGLLGYNMFAYCGNNPVMRVDPNGLCWDDIWSGIQSGFDTFCSYYQTGLHDLERISDKIVQPQVDFMEDVANFDLNNDSEQKVLDSNYFSWYKGVPVFRIDHNRSGSFGAMFISRGATDTVEGYDTVRHEYGHTKQLEQLGPLNYALCIGLPSWQKWGSGEYYSKPWEITADIYGGVQSRPRSQEHINAGFAYLEQSKEVGPLVWFSIR